MAERDEVRVFGEPIDHRQHYRFAAHLWKPLNEVHCDVLPDRRGNGQGLKKTRRVEMLRLVALTSAAEDEVAHQLVGVRAVEQGAKTVERLLDPLVAHAMGRRQDVRPECRGLRNEDAAVVDDEAIHQGPCCTRLAALDLLAFVDGVLECGELAAQVRKELELWHGDGAHRHVLLVLVTARQSVGRRVLLPGLNSTLKS